MDSIGETLQNFVNMDIALYRAEGPLWLILLTSILLYTVFYLLVQRVPPFNDAEDDKMSKIFAIVLSLIVTTSSPITVGLMWMYINLGGWLIFMMTMFLFVYYAYYYFRRGHSHVSGRMTRLLGERREIGERTEDVYEHMRQIIRRLKGLTKDEIGDLKSIKKEIKNLKDDDTYEPESKRVISDIEHVKSNIGKNLRWIRKVRRWEENDPRSRRIMNINRHITEVLDDAVNALNGRNKGRAMRSINQAINFIKKEMKELMKLLKEDRGEVGEAKKKSTIGFDINDEKPDTPPEDKSEEEKEDEKEPEVKEDKSKEEGPTDEQKNQWKNFLNKKIDEINPLFKVNLDKHPKKAKNYIRDIRRSIDNDLVELVSNLGYRDNLDAYMRSFDQILDFLEHTKKPSEATQEDWASIMKSGEEYKNFLLAIRNKI